MLLAIHDVSFPSDPDEDVGRGSPVTRAAGRLFTYARELGFTGVQLGPQGQTAADNPSPYDGTIFSRNLGNISLGSLRAGGAFEGLVSEDVLDAALVTAGGNARHRHAHAAMQTIVTAAHASLQRGARPDLAAHLAHFRVEHAAWLERDALYAALCASYGGRSFRDWPDQGGDPAQHTDAMDRYALGQLLVHEEHSRLRSRLHGTELALYGDMQVGYSDGDAWAHAATFMRGYRMGAPPSRTNPEGQPWGYPVLDPAQYDGAARALVVARAEKLFAEYDSLRIDHPHGLICPWVYLDEGDPALSVRAGARLFESPDLPDHPRLAPFAIARPDQLDRAQPRYADRWMTSLDRAQVDQFATLFAALVEAAERNLRSASDLSCEVLSTMPFPLEKVLALYNLGRWRITQKANLASPDDVYRSESAQRQDWVMLGNHDTAPIFALVATWSPQQRELWARHLTQRLHLREPERCSDDGFLATAMLAELFVSRAENVSIFFADLFGYHERFNVPGLVDDANWTLRLPSDFETLHRDRLARGAALDLPLAIELALLAQEHGAERR
jgi:4-alpha-glucanotransferase